MASRGVTCSHVVKGTRRSGAPRPRKVAPACPSMFSSINHADTVPSEKPSRRQRVSGSRHKRVICDPDEAATLPARNANRRSHGRRLKILPASLSIQMPFTISPNRDEALHFAGPHEHCSLQSNNMAHRLNSLDTFASHEVPRADGPTDIARECIPCLPGCKYLGHCTCVPLKTGRCHPVGGINMPAEQHVLTSGGHHGLDGCAEVYRVSS
eukprot:scaffold98083_cov31-Tisochrysis_lutea.AAC.3